MLHSSLCETQENNITLYSCRYQPPIPADQVRPAAEFDQDAEAIPSGRGRGRGRRGRGRGRGMSAGYCHFSMVASYA